MPDNSYNYLLDCLARKVNSMNKTQQAEFGEKLKKHHSPGFIAELKERMKANK